MNLLNKNVLVLNQNFEPLSVCSAKRAVVMAYLGKVDIVETYDGLKFHSVASSIPLPSVVKLGSYIRVTHKRIMLSRKNIIKRDQRRCQYCGRTDMPLTVDHVVPKQIGGKDSWENLVCACVKCNNIKGNRTPDQAGLKLLSKPKRPNHITFIQRFIGISDYRWRRYLFLD
jgi:5-methylcytosine-specific restriction endonuclease McrA